MATWTGLEPVASAVTGRRSNQLSQAGWPMLRRELNREAEIRLDMEDVFQAVREVLSKEAIMLAGEITLKKRRKKRKAKSTAAAVAQAGGDAPSAAAMAACPPAVPAGSSAPALPS